MKLKNKIWFIIILVTIILSSVTISYARYVLNKSIDVNIYAPPFDAGTLDFSIKNNEKLFDFLIFYDTMHSDVNCPYMAYGIHRFIVWR